MIGRGLVSTITVVLILSVMPIARAGTIFIDNGNGSDRFDGQSAEIKTLITGPVRTFRRALELAQRGDTLEIRNTGRPYYEMLCLSGGRNSGSRGVPFTVNGNGATISGARALPSDGWRSQGNGVWRVSLTRKGYYRFFRDGKSVPEFVPESSSTPLEELPLGQWINRHGAVYYRAEENAAPTSNFWTYAGEEFGVSLAEVDNVRIVNLHVVGCRVDGIAVDGSSSDIVLDQVQSEENGRAGIAISGNSHARVINSRIGSNGRHSLVVFDRSSADVEDCDFGDVAPQVITSEPLR